MPNSQLLRFTTLSSVGLSLASLALYATAAEPTAQSEFDVEVYSQQGNTVGCGLSFLAGWVNSEQKVFAATGTLNFFAPDAPNVGSTVKVRATLGNQTREIVFAWVDVPSASSTKTFSSLTPNQTGPFYSFFGKPDLQGLVRLEAAAQRGFRLGLSIGGLQLDETVQLGPAPQTVQAKMGVCTRALAARLQSFGPK